MRIHGAKPASETSYDGAIRPMADGPFLGNMWRDARFSLRTLLKNPLFSVTAIAILAISIGGNTAVFTLVRAILLKPLDYRAPEELVSVSLDNSRLNASDQPLTILRFETIRASSQSFAGVGAFLRSSEDMILSGAGPSVAVQGARVSANFLDILGVRPALGRSFLPEEDVPDGRAVVMISSGLWKSRFGGDPQIVGRSVILDGRPHTLVGVLPPGFAFPFPAIDAWVTRPHELAALPSKFWRFVTTLIVFGRLKPGVSIEHARSEMQVLNHRYIAENPKRLDSKAGVNVRVMPLKERVVSGVRRILWVLFGAVGLVLLIACANIASLVLARASSRSREFAVRAAMGASRGRIIQQLIVESSVLAVIGGSLGIVVAMWCVRMITSLDVLSLPRAEEIHVDGLVLIFNGLISLATVLLFGLLPSFQASHLNLSDVLRERGAIGGGSSRWGQRFAGISGRELLVVGQVALSIVLLAGAALLLQSVSRLRNVDLGFRPAGLVTFKLYLPNARYDTPEKRSYFYLELERRLKTVPALGGVGLMRSIPTTAAIFTNVSVAASGAIAETEQPNAQLQSVTPGYFPAMGIPLVRGRLFNDRDNTPGASPVIVINEAFARRFWPSYPAGPDPVGQFMGEGADRIASAGIIGIVRDVREAGPDAHPEPEFYIPIVIHAPAVAHLVVQGSANPRSVILAVESELRAVDPDQAVSEVRMMDQILEAKLGQRRLTMAALIAFAAIAVLLAGVGLYGVMAYSVQMRTQELGIRRAIGASGIDILKLIVGRAVVLTIAGAVIGVGGAIVLGRVIQPLVFGVSPSDPATLAAVSVGFAIIAIAASSIPALRAIKVNPMTALRS